MATDEEDREVLPTMVSDGEDSETEAEDAAQAATPEAEYPHDTIEWTVKNFAELPVVVDGTATQPVNFIRSESKKTGDFEWGMKVYPWGWSGNVVQENEYLSLFCEIRNDRDVERGVKTKQGRFTVEVRRNGSGSGNSGGGGSGSGGSGAQPEMHEVEYTFSRTSLDRGWKEFMQRADLLDPENGFVQADGSVTFVGNFWRVPDPEPVQYSDYATKDYRKETGYIGLRNQGATCYMNSLLQTLYHTTAFARAVFLLPTEKDDPAKSIALALQRVFFNLKYAHCAVSTKELTQSFGWDTLESFQQHDVQELNRVLTDNLEEKMRGTPAEGMLARLLSGTIQHRIRCTKVDFESCREETFYDLSVDVQGCHDLYRSLDKYTETEMLDGDNMYDAGSHGKQPAEKGCKFLTLPPVLHIQLKRWVYDPRLDRSVKLNDKFEFPMTLDLERYLAADAPRQEPSVYELHAVLIHSGSAGGGHYYVFMRPTRKNEWFQFNDERVIPCKAYAAMKEGFGGTEYTYNVNGRAVRSYTKPDTSAYMLVYIRKSDIGNVLFHLYSRDIPYHLHKRFANDAAAAVVKQKEATEARVSKFVRLVTDSDLRAHEAAGDLFDPDNIQSVTLPNTTTLAALYAEAARKMGVDVSLVRLYPFERRLNKSYRIMTCFSTSQSFTLEKFNQPKLDFYVEVLSEPAAAPLPPASLCTLKTLEVLLFIRQYDPVKEKIAFVGTIRLSKKSTWSAALESIKSLVGVPAEQPLVVFNDNLSLERLDTQSPDTTLLALRLHFGDVLVVQPAPDDTQPERPRFPLLSDFVFHTTNLVSVQFVPLDAADSSHPVFKLSLPKAAPYAEVVQSVGEHVKADPTHIRLTGYAMFMRKPRTRPFSTTEAPRLSAMLDSVSDDKYFVGKVYYEVLDIRTEDAEKLVEVRVEFYDAHVKPVATHVLRFPSAATVADVAQRVAELHPEAGGSGQLRVCRADGHKLEVLQPAFSVATMASTGGAEKWYRVEAIPADESAVDKKRAGVFEVVHFEQDYSGQASLFGDPFFLVVPFGTRVAELRRMVQDKLQLTDEQTQAVKFASIKFSTPRMLADKDVAVSEKSAADKVTIGMMHPKPKSSVRSAHKPVSSRREHALVIKG